MSLVAHTGIDLTALTSHNRYFTISGMVYPRATGYALGIPPLVAVGFSLLSSIWPIALDRAQKSGRYPEDCLTLMLDVIQVTKHYRSGRGRLKALDQVSFAAADKTISLTDGRVDTITSGDRT